MRPLTFGLILVLPIALGGCYTIRGFGQDVAVAGRALTAAVDKVTGSEPATAETSPPAAAQQGSSGPPRSLSAPPPRAPQPPADAK